MLVMFRVQPGAWALYATVAQRLICWSRRIGAPHGLFSSEAEARHYEEEYGPGVYVWTQTVSVGVVMCMDADECAEYPGVPLTMYDGGPDMCPPGDHADAAGYIWVDRADPVVDMAACVAGPPVPPVPVVSGVAPAALPPAGGTLTVSGTGLTAATEVRLVKISDGAVRSLPFTVGSATQLAATVAAGVPAGTYRLEVRDGAGHTSTWVGTFTKQAPVPTITGISPNCVTAYNAFTLTITGTDLQAGGVTGFYVDDQPYTNYNAYNFTVLSNTQVRGSIGEVEHDGPGDWYGDVVVQYPGGTARLPAALRVRPPGYGC